MIDFIKSISLLLVLLNPFLVIIYLIDIVQKLDKRHFYRVLTRAAAIATVVFCLFAILGNAIFENLIQAEFASFQIFGGIVFLLIGIQFVFKGPNAIELLRGDSEQLTGAIAMPVLIGPGTISASVVIGKNYNAFFTCAVIISAVAIFLVVMFLLKYLHDYVRPRRELLIERYIEITGRITALFIGTIAVEMIMHGLCLWIDKLK